MLEVFSSSGNPPLFSTNPSIPTSIDSKLWTDAEKEVLYQNEEEEVDQRFIQEKRRYFEDASLKKSDRVADNLAD